MKPITRLVRDRCVALGGRIRQRRLAKDLSLQEVGDRMMPPKNKQYVCRIEGGEIDVGLDDLKQVAAILETSADELLEGVHLSAPGNPTVSSLLEFSFALRRSPACVVKEFEQGDPHAV